VIIRWGIAELACVLDELPVSRPLLVSSERWRQVQLPVHDRFHGVGAHAEMSGVKGAPEAAGGADGLVAPGGGSAIDTAKAGLEHTGLPVVSIPTAYSGAEWTTAYGLRNRSAGRKLGGDGARTVAIVYEPELTLGLPARESAGTAMNALAHCAKALYMAGRGEEADAEARTSSSRRPSWTAPGSERLGCPPAGGRASARARTESSMRQATSGLLGITPLCAEVEAWVR
jgi:maleylacetate reductase